MSFDPNLVVVALVIGALGYALLIARRGRERRFWAQFWRRVNG
ncbi:MAG TPA: hypothetical protein VHR55_10940 [Candidatus Limnocylindria bacterium]|nr:hypothetical protein [Candidatus Limnocylindria bacterium]